MTAHDVGPRRGNAIGAERSDAEDAETFVRALSGVTSAAASMARGETDWLGDFQALATQHRDAVYRLAYRLTGDRDDAEDLVQDSLVEAFNAFPAFKGGTRFDRWLYRIMLRNYIDNWRRRRRHEVVSLEDVPESLQVPDPHADPQLAAEEAAGREQLWQALEKLAPEFRMAVTLCDGQGFSYAEAGWIMRCPVGTVRSRLHRARERLRRLLGASAGSGE